MFTATIPDTVLTAASCKLPCDYSVRFKTPWHRPFPPLTVFLPPPWPFPSPMDIIRMQSGSFCRHHLPAATRTCVIDTQILAGFQDCFHQLVLCSSRNQPRFPVLPSPLSMWGSSMRGHDSAAHLQVTWKAPAQRPLDPWLIKISHGFSLDIRLLSPSCSPHSVCRRDLRRFQHLSPIDFPPPYCFRNPQLIASAPVLETSVAGGTLWPFSLCSDAVGLL